MQAFQSREAALDEGCLLASSGKDSSYSWMTKETRGSRDTKVSGITAGRRRIASSWLGTQIHG